MSATAEDTSSSLSDSIDVATGSIHVKLNELVLSRLRMALPPHADDASQYVSGLIHIAPIYIAFEALWKVILESPHSPIDCDPEENGVDCIACDKLGHRPQDCSDVHQRPVVCARIRPLLADLHLQPLERSQALQKDLISLTGWSDRTLAEQLNDASESPVLSNFLNHIIDSVGKSPHVLLAYAWVLYMTLFTSGRIMLSSLEDIYPGFWIPASAQQPVPATLAKCSSSADAQPLNFFRFDSFDDCEELKTAFKARLLESENVLNETERAEIIQEAQSIFDYMVQVVDELDKKCGTDNDREVVESRLLSLRSRDSVVVEKERRKQVAQMIRKATAGAANARPGSNIGKDGHIKFG